MMNQNKRKSLLNRKETDTLLNTLKMVTAAGAIGLTVAGWGLLAQIDTRSLAQAKANQTVAMAAPPPTSALKSLTSAPATPIPPTSIPQVQALPTATPQPVRKLDIVQWVQDTSGDPVAVVRDRRGTLWFVMGSDVPRLEQGQAPLIQPQPAQRFARTQAS